MNKQLIESLKQLMTTHCSSSSDGHDNRYYIKSQVDNKIKKPEMGISIVGTDSFIMYPEGGNYHSTATRETGYLKITFPVSWTHTMLSFQVTIYDYTINASATYHISGYTYGTGWYNVSAVCIGTYGRSLCNLPVRFGHDGSKCAVTIGEASTVWQYPQVQVHNIMTGYQSYGYNTWKTGWNVQITTTALTTINHTITNSHVANGVSIPWNSITGKPTTFPPATHSHNYASSNHTHSYLPLSGGTMTGSIRMTGNTHISFKPPTTGVTNCGIVTWNAEDSYGHNFYGFKGVSATCCGITAGIVNDECRVDSIDCGRNAWKQCTTKIWNGRENMLGRNIQLLDSNIILGCYYNNEVYLGAYNSTAGFGSGLVIQGNDGGGIYPTKDNVSYLGFSSFRWKGIYSATSTIATSDRNLKKDEKDFDDEFITKLIMGLRPKTYKFKQNDSNRTHYGFIAQDIEDLLPELGISSKDIAAFIKTPNTKTINIGSDEEPVSEEEIIPEGEEGYGFTYSLRYEEFIAPLVRKVQMQQKEIEELKQTVTQLHQAITPPPHNLVNWKEEFSLEIAA